jgi:hypothetical protein
MADVVLSTVNLDVFGGPTSLEVSTDFGQPGDRGSRIWAGVGNPVGALAGEDTQLYDLYINTNTADQFYGWMYQLVPEVGNPQWVRILKLNPSQYSTIQTASFTDGADTTVITTQFTIRYSIESADEVPIASSFTYSLPTVSGIRYLRINLKAIKYESSAWADLSGNQKIHLFVSYLA